MICVESLSKRYGEKLAVDGISFEVKPGEVYGLLGPNGAGKTTTLSMVSGLLAADSGRVTFDGVDLAAEPLRVKSQEVALYEELSALENLRFWGSLYGLSGRALAAAVERGLELVGLAGRAKDAVKTYSGGMKRRLNLALGLVHSPRAVLLDEPTVGIDPQARASVLQVVRSTAAAGTSVLYTTHYLEEAEGLCDRIGILDHGRILAEGTLQDLKARLAAEEVVTLWGSFEPAAAQAALAGLPEVRFLSGGEGWMAFAAQAGGAAGLLAAVYGQSLAVDRVAIDPPSLNALFLKLTGRELRD